MNVFQTILILAFAFLAAFGEATLAAPRQWLGAQVDLLPALMVYASLSSGMVTITLLAVLGGLWFDALSSNPLGVTMLPLLLVGLAIHQQRGLVLREQLFAQWLFGLAASAAAPLLTLLLLLSIRQTPALSWAFLWQWVVMSLGGGILTPVCFRIFDRLGRSLNYRPVLETSFRPDREIRRGRS